MNIAIILAAGQSLRFRGQKQGSRMKKQYNMICDTPIVAHSINCFSLENINYILPVITKGDEEYFANIQQFVKCKEKLLPPIYGGLSRQESVKNAIDSLIEKNPTNILIHDGVRPNIGKNLIDNVCDALRHTEAVIPVIPITDTVKRCKGGIVQETLNREELFKAQTPQGFRYKTIRSAYYNLDKELANFTDDAAIMEYMSIEIKTIEGDNNNIKVTTLNDLKFLEYIYENRARV